VDPERNPQAAALARRFGENLVVARGRVDLGQVGAAERAGLHRSEFSQLERGLRLPRLDTIAKLAGAVEVKPCELLTGMGWRLGDQELQMGGIYVPGTYVLEPEGQS
jgi:transcriptional regulator with XRE-family HTH domain